MKEIKFRAWNKAKNEIVYFDLRFCNEESRTWYKEHIHNNPVMLCIGLKDKNGVEIYEGDILHEKIEKKVLMKKKGVDRLVIVEDIRSLEFWNMHSEVLGNIYENPELLNN